MKVDANAQGPITNTAAAVPLWADPDLTNNTATVVTNVQALPTITTQAPATAPVGQPISDVATLAGGASPTGAITFQLFGPDDAVCAGPPIFTSTTPVDGNGEYTSDAFTPTAPGTYRWIAAYSGDVNNTPATGACGDPNEQTRVLGLPTIMVVKTATPTTLPEPGGQFSFDVVVTNTGPNELTITSLVDSVYGNLATRGTCTTAVGQVLAPDPDGPAGPGVGGAYACSFTESFTGPGGASETDVVTVVGVDELGSQATDDDDATITIINVVPDILVEKSVTPETMPEPGGTFTISVVVTNTSIEALTIASLTDDVYGDLNTRGTCTGAVGQVLAPNGGTYTCSFQADFIGNAGDTETGIVTVVVIDDENTTVTDEDDATVTLIDVLPTVQVIKTANPLTMGEPGGTFTFSVVVTNTSIEEVTNTSLTDDVYGNLATKGTCTEAIGTVLQPGETYDCSFAGEFTGTAGQSQTDVVRVVVTDDEGNPATDDDVATVTITPTTPPATAAPAAQVPRVPGTSTLPRTGAGVTDLLTLAFGLVAVGGLLVLKPSRWVPPDRLAARRWHS